MNKLRQLGQGMTEYIIIVALIAIAGIAAWGFFGDTMQAQVANTASGLAGGTGVDADAQAQLARQEATENKDDMSTFDDK